MSFLQESDRNDQLYRQLKQALMEVEESKREAYEECVRRFKAENTAVEAIRTVKYMHKSIVSEDIENVLLLFCLELFPFTLKAREYEAMFNEEARLRKEGKEALAKQRKMVEKTKQERDDALIIILNGRKLYNEELRRRVEAQEMLGKEKEEHERTKKEMEEVRVIVQDGTVRNRNFYRTECSFSDECLNFLLILQIRDAAVQRATETEKRDGGINEETRGRA